MARKPDSHATLSWQSTPSGLGLLLTTLALLCLGVVMVHSAVASVAEPGEWYARRDVRHTLFAAAAAVVLMLAWRLDYRRLAGRGRLPAALAVALGLMLICGLLVYVPGIGHEVGGRYRWLRIGPECYSIGFQPSELIELALVIFLSAWLTRETTDVRKFWRTFVPAVGLILLCVGFVIREDFGTGLLIGVGGMTALFLAGVPWYYLLTFLPPLAGGVYVFVVRDAHRWSRITAMIDPWCTTNDCTYQARQSLLAIMSGGWFGKGLGHGMLKRGFLPEGSTDFIFATYCEEWGMVGAMLLVGLLLIWMFNAWRAAIRAPDRFGHVLAGSLGFLIAFQAVLHIAVDLVAVPPTGIGLPFVSAGGTRLVVMAAAVSLIISVNAHHDPQLAAAGDEQASLPAAAPG